MNSATAQIVQDVLDQMLLLCECGEGVAKEPRGLCAECEARENPRCGKCGELFRHSDYDEYGKQNGELCGGCEIAEESRLSTQAWRRNRVARPERNSPCHSC